MSVVSNRVEYDASLDQICQNMAKYDMMGKSIVPRSWIADPTRENAVTAVYVLHFLYVLAQKQC